MQPAFNVPLLMIFLPMLTAMFIPIIKNNKAVCIITIFIQIIMILASFVLIISFLPASDSSFVFSMGHFPSPWGNELRAGIIEAILSFVFSIVLCLSLIGGLDDINKDISSDRRHLYFLMINLFASSLMALTFTNDFFTAYVFLEINTIVACAIVVAKENGKTLIATIKYLIMSVIGSRFFLLSLSILYGVTGHLLMEPAHEVIANLAQTGQYHLPLIVTFGLFTVSVGVKSALFPFHSWLPDAHASATTTSSAILSALVLKGYIVLFIKFITRVYGLEIVKNLGILNAILLMGLLGIIIASIFAIYQTDIKKRIAYSTITQIGYIFVGIGFGSYYGITTAIFHIMAHAVTKSMLFIAVGSLINTTGSYKIADLAGAAKNNKLASIAFSIGALSMVGLPLTAGFPSKFYLAFTNVKSGVMWLPFLVIAISVFLNAIYYIPVIFSLFSDNQNTPKVNKTKIIYKIPTSTCIALICLIVANFILGIFFNPILKIILIGVTNLGPLTLS